MTPTLNRSDLQLSGQVKADVSMYRSVAIQTKSFGHSQKIAVIVLKFEQCCFTVDANKMANSVDPDQTAPMANSVDPDHTA